MANIVHLNRTNRDLWPVACAGAALVLIVAWLLFGTTGVFAWSDYSRKLADRRVELAELKVEQIHLENRARLLNPAHVDPDLSDELVRSNLNLLHPDEIVVPLK
ncbi:MAG: FtsB family cell division protein [Sphingopyxis sp.]